jgi:hypothetical protein
MGVSAIVSREREVTDVDLTGLVRRLILFDKYVLVSTRLKEFPILARYLGYEGLRDLLSARLIEIRCDCFQLGQTGQSGLLGDPILPYLSYKFSWLAAHDKEKYIHDCLQSMHDAPGLQQKQIVRLKGAIAGAIRPLPSDLPPYLFPPFRDELLHNNQLLKTAIGMEVRRRLHLNDVPFSLIVHQELEDTFKVETNLERQLRITEIEAHKIIERALLAVAQLTQTIGEMKCYSALSGFRDEELPLFRKKLDFLAEAVSSQTAEGNFQRVLDVAYLPDFSPSDYRIDIEKLLKARDASEAREFRDWLGTIGQSTDQEIKDRVNSLRVHIGLNLGGTAGKAMRFLVTSGIALIHGAVIPAAILGAFDQFLLEKLFPRSGIAAFVNELYPSIFDTQTEATGLKTDEAHESAEPDSKCAT